MDDDVESLLLGTTAGAAETRLWGAALALLIDDARRYWQGKRKDTEAEAAFDDVLRTGPMIRHCCRWLEADPEVLSKGFIRWCESDL